MSAKLESSAWFTPYELTKFDPQAEGFGDIVVDLTKRDVSDDAIKAVISAEEGKLVAQRMGCVGCHSTTDPKITTPGPSWVGLYGRERRLTGNGTVTAASPEGTRMVPAEPSSSSIAAQSASVVGVPRVP